MKIALLDLNHRTCGIHTNTVPFGLGLIAVYLKKTVNQAAEQSLGLPSATIDIKMFKDADKALDVLKSWVPDVIGISQYVWNTQLNLYVAKKIKKINESCVVIAGGPNLDRSKKGKKDFLKANDFIDICVEYDGEIPFATIVKRLLSGESIASIKKSPSAGTYSINPETKELAESSERPPRLDSLDVFGPLYTEGLFDEFLKEGYHPFLQTHRGCPFSCVFCHTSDQYYSHILFLSPEIFRKDMEYLGRLFAGRHDINLFLANTNMSLFKEDFPIAKIIREVQEKYGWPKFISINSGKDPKKLIEMLSIIKFMPGISLQTLTPCVLENIGRKNISLEAFHDFQDKVLHMTGEQSVTELILALPGETKETFLDSLKKTINSGVQNVVIYTLMNLKGTPLASEEFANRYKHVICHRVVPREFSIIDGERIFDTEEVVVGTKDMPLEDYIELRGIYFTTSAFFGSNELIPLKRFLFEYKIDIADWVFNIHAQLQGYPDLRTIYEHFLKETREELFPTRESLIEFFSKPENYKDLIEGRRGDNLIRKYRCIVLSENYESYLKIAISEARKLAYEKLEKEKADLMIDDLERYLSTRDMKHIITKNELPPAEEVALNHDILSWLKCEDRTRLFEEFKGTHQYLVKFLPDTIKKLDGFREMNKDETLSLQMIYRDGGIKYLWPVWAPKPEF